MKNTQKEIPVYLFLGFLESGKTQFIQDSLESEDFNDGAHTLLLVCEEGVEEYNPKRFAPAESPTAKILLQSKPYSS